MTTDSFGKCLILDGCFMIELFPRNMNPGQYAQDSSNDMLFSIRWMKPRLARDMLLFENQIPLLVLRALFSLAEQTTKERDIVELALGFFEFNGKSIPNLNPTADHLDNIPHFLGLVHEALVFREKREALVPKTTVELIILSPFVRLKKALVRKPHVQPKKESEPLDLTIANAFFSLREAFQRETTEQLSYKQKSCGFISTAVALDQVGVTFVQTDDNVVFHGIDYRDGVLSIPHLVIDDHTESIPRLSRQMIMCKVGMKFQPAKDCKALYDITFSNGLMRIPRLEIYDSTESFFRNLVAYEQHSKQYILQQVADYLQVMNCLINTPKDVELLRHYRIIDNRIGNDEKVSAMFNRLCSGVSFVREFFLYTQMFDEVNKFCNNLWKKRMTKLKNEYFGCPWALISFMAAALLLLLTALQTVYSPLSYYHP